LSNSSVGALSLVKGRSTIWPGQIAKSRLDFTSGKETVDKSDFMFGDKKILKDFGGTSFIKTRPLP
jgi:hypothetical protein